MQLPGRNQSDGTAGSPGNPTGRLRIEAENYSGQQDVEREACGDLGGTLNIGYIDVGNFITYDVIAPVSGTYTINFRLANGGPAAAFQLRDSLTQTVLATINVPYTGGWQSYLTLSATATLPAGQQILQLLCTANNWNLNWLELLPPATGSGGYNGNGAYHIEAEDFISQNGTLLENCLDAGATYNIGSINEGDWLDYRINMPVGGNYQFSLRAASGNGSNSVQLRTQNGTVLATLNVGNTGGYQTFATFTGNVILPAGVQTLRLQVTGGYMAVNWLELSAPPGAPPLDNYALIVRDNPYNTGGGLMYEAENTFTVEFWVKPSGEHEIDGESPYGTGGTSGQKYVMYPTNGGDGYGSRAGMGVSVGTNGVSVYEHADNYMPAVLVWQRPIDTAWMHVAVVYRNGKPSLYINGEWKRDGVQSSRQHVYPGTQFPGGFYGSQTNGQVDEIRIWSVARTQQQIAANMNGELSTATNNTGLQGYWPMNEGAGAVLHDVSGAGRHIDLTSAGYSGASWTNGSYSVTTTAASYRYAFNGKELDQDIGEDDYDYGMRIYDARLGKFLSTDPLFKSFSELTPYQFASNTPIESIDLDGMEAHSSKKDGFWKSFGKAILNMAGDGISYIYNNPNHAGYSQKPKPITQAQIDKYSFNLGDLIDPTKQIQSFSHNLVYGTTNFVGGIIDGDGKRTANAIPPLLSAVSTVSIFRGKISFSNATKASTIGEIDIALGKNINLSSFANKTSSSSFHTWSDDIPGFSTIQKAEGFYNFEEAFEYATDAAINTNGKIKFNLEHVNLQQVGQIKKGTGLYQELKEFGGKSLWDMGMITEWEASQVLNNPQLSKITEFKRMGMTVPESTVRQLAKPIKK